MRIDSSQNQYVKLAKSLHSAGGREDAGLFLAEGPTVVAEALLYAPDIEWVAWCPDSDDPDCEALADAARQAAIPVHELSERSFGAMSDARTAQGIAAVLRIRRLDLTAVSVAAGPALALVLHEVRDPGNLGTMIRSADAFGACAVVLSGSCVDPWEPKVVRATAGSLFHLPIVEAQWRQVTGWAADHGFSLVAAVVDATHVLGRVPLPPRAAIVIGNEAAGLPDEVLRQTSFGVRIAMSGAAESLNAAVAAGILLYEARRQPPAPGAGTAETTEQHNGRDGEK